MKLLNQYSSRTVPDVVGVSGTATNTATVTVNFEPTERKGDYWWAEAPAENAWGPLWLGITNIAVLDDAPNADIIATNFGHVYVPQSPETFTYDDDGNLTGDGRWSYAWDGENRATSFTSVASAPDDAKVKLDCQYDSQWRRIEKVVSTWTGSAYAPESTNRFVYDGWNLMAILDDQSSILQSFVRGLDLSGTLQGAGGTGGLLWVTATGEGTHFVCFDRNGNVMALVDASDSSESARYEYGPFSENIRSTGPMAQINPIGFSTQYTDDVTGDRKYKYRDYRPDIGRWISRDPIQERGGLNLVAFVRNYPTSLIDKLGLGEWSFRIIHNYNSDLPGQFWPNARAVTTAGTGPVESDPSFLRAQPSWNRQPHYHEELCDEGNGIRFADLKYETWVGIYYQDNWDKVDDEFTHPGTGVTTSIEKHEKAHAHVYKRFFREVFTAWDTWDDECLCIPCRDAVQDYDVSLRKYLANWVMGMNSAIEMKDYGGVVQNGVNLSLMQNLEADSKWAQLYQDLSHAAHAVRLNCEKPAPDVNVPMFQTYK